MRFLCLQAGDFFSLYKQMQGVLWVQEPALRITASFPSTTSGLYLELA